MKDKTIEKIKEIGKDEWIRVYNDKTKIKKLIKKYATHYYEGKALITDNDFEYLVDVLKIMDENDELFMTSGWGYTIKNGRHHRYCRIGTVKYSFDYDEIKKLFEGEKDLFVLPKYDGINFVAYYRNGKLDYCCTRGNGFVGKDITKKFKKDSFKIDSSLDSFAINGEIIYDDKTKKDKTNFRDIVATTVNKKIFYKCHFKNIKFVPFGIINVDLNYEKQLELLQKMYYEELPIYRFKELPSKEELRKMFDELKNEYAIDGLVITNVLKTRQYAYKFKE